MKIYIYSCRKDIDYSKVFSRSASVVSNLEEADLLVACGGDGTIVSAIHFLAKFGLWHIPVFGYNTGTLGFLSNDFDIEAVKVLLKIEHTVIQRRDLLQINVDDKQLYAINDVVIQPTTIGKLCEIPLILTGAMSLEEVEKSCVLYKGDGVIISTASGSTAYNLSAGGPIVAPKLQALIVTPICPFSFSARPLVLPLDIQIQVPISNHTNITVDGVVHTTSSDVTISKAKNQIKIVKHAKFLDSIQSKLGWNTNIKN